MNELKIQHDYVMEFLCRQEEKGGLGYRNESNIVVSNDLFIPSVLGEFVKDSQPDTWTRLVLGYVILAALYGSLTSKPSIILKQGGFSTRN